MSGLWGGFATGLFCEDKYAPTDGFSNNGAFFGNPDKLGKQILAMIFAAGWSFFISLIILKILDLIIGIKVAPHIEEKGLDHIHFN